MTTQSISDTSTPAAGLDDEELAIPKGARFCSVVAQQRNLDPIGSASGITDQFLVLEVPTPWPDSMYDEAGKLPVEVLQIFGLMRERYQRKEHVGLRMLFIAPEPEVSQQGFRRLMYFSKPNAPFARYEKLEYVVPESEAGALCWAIAQHAFGLPENGSSDMTGFAIHLQPSSSVRDLMICTHGSVDAACAKFGYPLYRHLRDAYGASSQGQLRIWRVTHFGGHVYAPTLLDLPEGRYWGFIGKQEAGPLVKRDSAPDRLRKHYRGWSGLEHGFEQVLEREAWLREGWAWMDYLKHSRIVTQDTAEEPQWAEVQLTYAASDGTPLGAYEARVSITHHIETEYSSGDPEKYPYPQYAVSGLTHIAPNLIAQH